MEYKYTMNSSSTRGLWRVLENGENIAICQNKPNARTLVSILNAHDTLTAKADLYMAMMQELFEMDSGTGEDANRMHEYIEDGIKIIKALK